MHNQKNSLSQLSGKAINPKDLQRKIFLNTMRNVYPDSVQIKYGKASLTDEYILKPLSVSDKFRKISDKVWAEIIFKLNLIFNEHVATRFTIMTSVWIFILLNIIAFVVVGLEYQLFSNLAFVIVGPVFIVLLIIFLPNIIFSYVVMRKFLKSLDIWRTVFCQAFDKCGVEIIKITTGEIVSGKGKYKMLGTIFYGSSVWFRYEDAAIEIFWRSVKSGKKVRRYSLMISGSGDELGSKGLPNVTEELEVRNSNSTLGSMSTLGSLSSSIKSEENSPKNAEFSSIDIL
jgi:hypothetical protein